jgi:hypothetical protein
MQGQPRPWWHKWLAGSDRNERVKNKRIWAKGISGHSWLLYQWAMSPYSMPGNRTRVARMGILHDTTTPYTNAADFWKFFDLFVKNYMLGEIK